MYFAFVSIVAGIFTAFTPCVLPMIPLMLAGSEVKQDNKYKKIKIISSLILSVFVFTLLLKYSTILIDVNLDYLKIFSGLIIMSIGVLTFYPNLWVKIMQATNIRNKIQELSGDIGKNVKGKSYRDYVLGATLGPIFSSCSPTYFVILATVLPVSFYLGILYLMLYCTGLGFSLYIISIFGESIINFINKNKKIENMTTKIIAVILFVTGLIIVLGYDTYIEKKLPTSKVIQNVEGKLLENSKGKEMSQKVQDNTGMQKDMVKEDSATLNQNKIETEKLGIKNTEIKVVPKLEINNPKPSLQNTINKIGNKTFAPELSGISGYINTKENISLADALSKNKVVIVYFWTFGCINCQRSLPSLNDLYAKYKDSGLEIIGVHTPEFAYEQKIENVKEAMGKLGVKFPVVLDNNYSTWRSYDNNYWPRKYIILPTGEIIYDHSGEGAYEEIADIVTKIINTK